MDARESETGFRAAYTVSGHSPEHVFAALLDFHSFPEWSIGLRRVRLLDAAGTETGIASPGTTLEFTLSAVGLSHRIVSRIAIVEPPHRLEWRYMKGASGMGGWHIEAIGPGVVCMTLASDYDIEPAWLNEIAQRPFFRGVTMDLLGRSMRRFARRLERFRPPDAPGSATISQSVRDREPGGGT